MKQELMRANGSVQHIEGIPADIKELYKTVWEMSMKDIIDMARHRGYFIDQSQSLNLFMEGATMAKLTSMHFYAWKSGLKTGMYYLRTKSAVDAIKFTLSNKESTGSKRLLLWLHRLLLKGGKATKATAIPVEPLTPEEKTKLCYSNRVKVKMMIA